MSTWINSVKNMIQRDPKWSVRGPVLQSYLFDREKDQNFYVLEFEVAHGTHVTPTFGYFIEIVNERNTNKSRVRMRVAPDSDEEGKPIFEKRCSIKSNLNQYICKYRECRQILPKDYVHVSDADEWDFEVNSIDSAHVELVTREVIEYNTVATSVWDNHLNKETEVEEFLSKTRPTSGLIQIGAAQYNYVTSEKINCNYYLVRKEFYSSYMSEYSYFTTENFAHPRVMVGTPSSQILTGRQIFRVDVDKEPKRHDFPAGVMVAAEYKEAYTAPRRCKVTVDWVAEHDPNFTLGIDVYQPQGFDYQGISFNWSMPPCLHDAFFIVEDINTPHPRLAPMERTTNISSTGNMFFPFVASKEVQPYKGGYLRITKTFY